MSAPKLLLRRTACLAAASALFLGVTAAQADPKKTPPADAIPDAIRVEGGPSITQDFVSKETLSGGSASLDTIYDTRKSGFGGRSHTELGIQGKRVTGSLLEAQGRFDGVPLTFGFDLMKADHALFSPANMKLGYQHGETRNSFGVSGTFGADFLRGRDIFATRAGLEIDANKTFFEDVLEIQARLGGGIYIHGEKDAKTKVDPLSSGDLVLSEDRYSRVTTSQRLTTTTLREPGVEMSGVSPMAYGMARVRYRLGEKFSLAATATASGYSMPLRNTYLNTETDPAPTAKALSGRAMLSFGGDL